MVSRVLLQGQMTSNALGLLPVGTCRAHLRRFGMQIGQSWGPQTLTPRVHDISPALLLEHVRRQGPKIRHQPHICSTLESKPQVHSNGFNCLMAPQVAAPIWVLCSPWCFISPLHLSIAKGCSHIAEVPNQQMCTCPWAINTLTSNAGPLADEAQSH